MSILRYTHEGSRSVYTANTYRFQKKKNNNKSSLVLCVNLFIMQGGRSESARGKPHRMNL